MLTLLDFFAFVLALAADGNRPPIDHYGLRKENLETEQAGCLLQIRGSSDFMASEEFCRLT